MGQTAGRYNKTMKAEQGKTVTISSKKQTFMDWTLDLLIYIVILNFFAEYSSSIYFETFTISVLTAIVLKILLVWVISLEHSVSAYFGKKKQDIYKYINLIVAFSILFLSKFVILEIVDILFGTYVEIKGFIPLVAMIITMIVTRKVIDSIYKNL